MDSNGKDNAFGSINEYFDAKEEGEEEVFFPAESMTIENEWISNKDQPNTMDTDGPSPFFGNARVESETVRFISPIQKPVAAEKQTQSNASSPKINRSILNELLPTQIQLGTSGDSGDSDREWPWLKNDKFFGFGFKVSLAVWALLSLYLMSTKSTPIVGHENMTEITGWFACLLLFGSAMTAVWAKVLAEQTEVVVYGLMLAVPAGFGLLGLYSLSHWFILSGIALLSIGAIFCAALYFNRATLQTTVEIVHNAAIFIQATPKVYSLVLKIVAVYVVFVWFWLKAFSRLFSTNWSLLTATVVQLAFFFMLIWTGAVLGIYQKFVIATWVRSWMNRTEDVVTEEAEKEEETVKLLDDESFGTVCLAAGLLTAAKMTRMAVKGTHFTVKVADLFVPISSLFSWLLTSISAVERFMQRFTDFAIYYLAVEGKDRSCGFVGACTGLSRAVEGHLGLALTTDATAQLLLTFSTMLISFVATAAILLVAKNHVFWRSGVLIGLLAASVTDFVSSTYTAAIDAMFLCYVMDLKRADRAGKIDASIQSAFGPKLQQAV